MRGEAISLDHFRIGSNCSGLVAMEQTTDVSIPALSIDAKSEDTRPSLKAFTPPPRSRWLMARAASASGKTWA